MAGVDGLSTTEGEDVDIAAAGFGWPPTIVGEEVRNFERGGIPLSVWLLPTIDGEDV